MSRTITVKHTADRHRRPLACVSGLPGEGAEFNAEQLRQLAGVLLNIADACDQGAGLAYPETATYNTAARELADEKAAA